MLFLGWISIIMGAFMMAFAFEVPLDRRTERLIEKYGKSIAIGIVLIIVMVIVVSAFIFIPTEEEPLLPEPTLGIEKSELNYTLNETYWVSLTASNGTYLSRAYETDKYPSIQLESFDNLSCSNASLVYSDTDISTSILVYCEYESIVYYSKNTTGSNFDYSAIIGWNNCSYGNDYYAFSRWGGPNQTVCVDSVHEEKNFTMTQNGNTWTLKIELTKHITRYIEKWVRV
jgi:hypothetical protein